MLSIFSKLLLIKILKVLLNLRILVAYLLVVLLVQLLDIVQMPLFLLGLLFPLSLDQRLELLDFLCQFGVLLIVLALGRLNFQNRLVNMRLQISPLAFTLFKVVFGLRELQLDIICNS